MDLRLSNRQQTLQKIYAQFFAGQCSPAVVRQMEHPLGGQAEDAAIVQLQAKMWSRFTTFGSTKMTLAGQFGGLGWGQGDALAVAEVAGRALYQSPYLDTLSVIDILQAVHATPAQHQILAEIGRGECAVALAVREHGRTNPGDLSSLALAGVKRPDGWAVRGEKRFIVCARQAQYLLLGVSISGRLTLFLTPTNRTGIRLRRHDDIGRGELYAATLDNVTLTSDDLVGGVGDGADPYLAALTRARVRHAGYLIGMCQALFDATLEFTKSREQFGRPIGTFQSIAFRLASFAARIDAARLLAYYTAWQTDQGEDMTKLACELLAQVGDLALEFVADALQMHGSYGLTEQAEAQRYYRRAAVDVLLLGTPAQLRVEAAALLAAASTGPALSALALGQTVAATE